MVFCSILLVSLRHPLSTQTPCGKLFQNIEQLCFLMKTATCSVSFLRTAFSTLGFIPAITEANPTNNYFLDLLGASTDSNPWLLNQKSWRILLYYGEVNTVLDLTKKNKKKEKMVRVCSRFIKCAKTTWIPTFLKTIYTFKLLILKMSNCGGLHLL